MLCGSLSNAAWATPVLVTARRRLEYPWSDGAGTGAETEPIMEPSAFGHRIKSQFRYALRIFARWSEAGAPENVRARSGQRAWSVAWRYSTRTENGGKPRASAKFASLLLKPKGLQNRPTTLERPLIRNTL